MELKRNSSSVELNGLHWDVWRCSEERQVEAARTYRILGLTAPSTTEVHRRVVVTPLCFSWKYWDLPQETMAVLPGRNLSPVTDPLEAFYAAASYGVGCLSKGEQYVASAALGGGVRALVGGHIENSEHPLKYAKHALLFKTLKEPNPNVFMYGIRWARREQIMQSVAAALLRSV